MIRKIYDFLLYTSSFLALLSIWCKVLVVKYDILDKPDGEIVSLFFFGVLLACFMVFLLHRLFRRVQQQ